MNETIGYERNCAMMKHYPTLSLFEKIEQYFRQRFGYHGHKYGMTGQKPSEKKALGSAWIAVICPNTDKLLLGRRAAAVNNGGQWNLFGGGIEENETAVEAALREFNEEAGFEITADQLDYVGVAPGNLHIFVAKLTKEHVQAHLNVNHAEIEKTKWFGLDDMPEHLHKSARGLLYVLDIPNSAFHVPLADNRSPEQLSLG